MVERTRVESNRAADKLGRRMPRCTTHEGPQSCEHFLHMERLADIIVCARVEAADLVRPAVPCRQNEHGRRPARLTHAFQHGDTVLFGQANIEHDRVVWLRCGEEQALLAVERAIDDIASLLQSRDKLAIQITVILDDEQSQAFSLSAAPYLDARAGATMTPVRALTSE